MSRADEVLSISNEVAVMTSGTSMRPMLRQHKDVVVIERVNRKLKKNDVPLYRRDGAEKLVLHRIVKIKDGRYIIRGDNNYYTEYDITDDNIVGVLKEFYRDGKYYNCATSKVYKLYSFWILHSYPLRYFWRIRLKPFLSKIKHFVLN